MNESKWTNVTRCMNVSFSNLIVTSSFMIPVLRSIDTLINRFDELSKYHADLLSNFDTNFSEVENPLRNVARTEDEQRKKAANILLVVNENDDELGSIKTIEDFHQSIIKKRYHHGPPSYASNDSSLSYRVSTRTELTSFSQRTIKANTSQSVVPTSSKNMIEPKVALKNPPLYARGTVTEFTMETVNRLSKPKAYHQLPPDQKATVKRVQRRPKLTRTIKKEISECSTSSIPPPIKRTKATTTIVKPSPKKLKLENKTPANTSSRPLIFVIPVPTIHLTFPMQTQQQSSRIGILPTTNKRSIIPKKYIH
jgi:hypothetical protein